MAFTYREVKDLYDVLADAGVTTKSLPEWSAEMAGVTGSDIYDAGLNDNILKRMSVGIDRGLESVPGLIEGGRSLGGGIGSLFGMEDVGREVGATLPRQAVNFLPMMIPALGPVGKVGTAFLSGIDAYTQSGSPAAGLISGVTSALLPGAANLAGQGTLSFLRNRGLAKGIDEALLPRLVQGQNALGWTKGIGGLPIPAATEKVSELFGRNLAQRGAAEGAGQLAALGLVGIGSVATDLVDGNGVSNPFSAENLLGQLIGQVPFSAMHLTGKAFSGSKSRADMLEAAVQKTERALALKEVAERVNERTDIEKIPEVPRTEIDPQVMEDTNAILSKLGLEREAIKANPTTENVEQLKKIAEQEDAAVQTLIQQTNGVGLGISRRETKLDPKIAVKGTDAVFDPNLSRGEGKGFYHVTITEVPPGTRDSNGVEVKPGDRVRFPAGFYDPQENTNLASPEFLLPTSKGKPKFTVVENRPKTERPAAKAPAKTFTEEDKIAWSKGTAKKAPTLEQSKELLELKRQEVQYDFDAIAERRKELDQLERDASSVGSSSEFLDYLARINEVRERAGYPPIDLASLQKVAVKNKIRGNINAALALVHETRNMEVAEELGKRKALEEDEHRVGVQENIYALAEDKTSPFKEEAQRILDLYHGLSEESGNRGIIATTGQFWAIVDELSKKHGVKGLAERVQGRIGKLATGEGLKKPEQAKPTHIPIFEPLSKADSATIQLIGTKVLEWLNATTHTEENMRELKVFKDLLLEGNFESTPDDVIMKAVENGFVSGTIDERGNIEDWSKLEGEEFVAQYKKLGLFEQINKIREEAYKQNARPSASPRPEAKRLRAGDVFVHDLVAYNEQTRMLGKHTLPKDGMISVAQFKVMGKEQGTLPDAVIALGRELVPEAFEGDRVNVPVLMKGLKEKGPVVEVKKLGENAQAGNGRAVIQHWLDTEHPNWTYENRLLKDENGNVVSPANLPGEITRALMQSDGMLDRSEGASRYSFLSPKSEQDMPGYVEGLVRLPTVGKPKGLTGGDDAFETRPDWQIAEDNARDAQQNVKYRGPHFGSEDTNVLAFFRGYEETLPDGRKAFHVIEVQSDWGQAWRKSFDATAKYNKEKGEVTWTDTRGNEQLVNVGKTDDASKAIAYARKWIKEQNLRSSADFVETHPLLASYETLALKAAMQHARSVGAEAIILSDAETAMMTEGHDKAMVGQYVIENTPLARQVMEREGIQQKDAGQGVGFHVDLLPTELRALQDAGVKVTRAEPSQSPGMRLHYDTTLPSAMKKLTGTEGERVELGIHKQGIGESSMRLEKLVSEGVDTELQARQEADAERRKPEYRDRFGMNVQVEERNGKWYSWIVQPKTNVVGSPVFRNPDGTPKSAITGRLYPLAQAFAKQDAQGGFTLTDPSRSPKPEPASKPYEPATESGKLLATQLTTDGHGLVAHLQQSNDPITKALANDLLKHFPNALRMVKSSVTDAGGNLAYRGEGRDILIDFSPGMLTAAPWARENVILHELIHGLTLHEIEGMGQDNPHNKTLTKIREKLISALPANLRKAYDAAVKSDWHNRWLDATTEEAKDALDAELHDTESGRQILYALLNNQEMAAQGFSSHSFRGYMQSVPGVNGAKTGLRAFAGWVKNLLNIGENVSATAFEEFMDATHQLMARGEYFAKLQDYGQKYFESKGVDPQYGKAQTERALGIVMESGRGISRQELASSLGMGEHQLNPTLTKARKAMEKEFEGKDSQFLASLMDESGHENLDDLVETAVAEGRDVGEVLDLLPPASAAFVFEKLRDHKEVLELLNAATKKKGTVNIAQPEKLRAPVLKTLKEIDRILEKEQEQIEMAEQLAGLDAVEPREFVQKLSKPSAAPRPEKSRTKTEELPPMEFLRKFASPLSWFAEPFTQAAQRIPELAEINTLAHQQKANANVIATQALKPFGMDMSNEAIDVVSEKSVAESQKAFGSPKLMDKINRYIALNNMTNKDKVVVLPGNHPEVQKLMNGLTPDEQAIVHDMVQKHSVSTQTLQAHVLQFMEKEVAVRGAGVIGIENGGKTRDNVALAGELIRGLLQVRKPETQMIGDAAIKKVQARLTPEAFLNVLQYANEQAERIDLVGKYFKENPAWSTAQAMERYHFTFLKDGKSRRGQASSIKERDLIIQKAGGKLMETKDTWKGRDDEPFVFPNMSPETARRIQEIDENAIKMMLSKGLLDEEGVAEYRKNISPAQQILREGSAAGGLPLDVMAPARKLGQGAEDLPWMWNHVAHAERTANYWTRRLLRAQRDVYLRDPELTPELQQYAKTHIDNLLQNDPIVAQGVVRTASTWFLGWNLAFNMVNGTQPLVTHAPGLTAITGKPLDSYRRIGRAVTEVLRSHKNKRFDTQEHDKFMREAQSDLQRAIGNRDEQEMLEDGVATGLKRMLKKNKPQTIGQRIAEGAGAYSRASMYLARAGENFNADIALLAAFDLYRGTINPETGVNHTYAEAKEKAYQYNQAVNFSGGRAARPVGAYSGRAPALRSAAMIGTALQSYVLGTTSTFARYIQHGFMRPKGITPQESYAARKALVQMAATQFAAAGLLGMPFVSGALALLEELFPDLEPNKNVREMVNNFLSSDAENGGAMTDMAMTGLPSMLGWDMQSRLSMGNTLPGVSEVNGFQPENLMGPAVNIVKNFVNGVTGLAAGDDKAGMNFFPPAIRKMVEAGKASLGGEGIRDFRGSPLEDATPGESVGQFLGFQPKRLSDQNVAGRIARRSDEAASRRQSQERQQMAEEVLKGNFGSVRTKLLQSTQSDKNFDPRAEVRAIARAAEELKFPRDLRREGRKGTDRGEFLRSYSNVTSSPSEVARFQFRQQVAQRLGLPASSSRDLQEAQMMDQLKAQRPDATRSELRAAVQLALRRSGVQPLLEE